MMVQISIEQQIRNILTDMEIEDAQKFTAGDLCELANILADKIKFEQELHMIDELLARRPALADFDTRIDRISYAIKVASQKDALEQRCKELEESQQKNCSGVEGGIYEVHSDKVYSTMKQEIDKLKTENAELERNMKAVAEYLQPNWSNDMHWCDEIIIAIDQRHAELVEKVRVTTEALKNQMQCVSELKMYLHNTQTENAELEDQLATVRELKEIYLAENALLRKQLEERRNNPWIP